MTAPYFETDGVTLHLGESLDVLPAIPDASIDAIITDPPYGLGEHSPNTINQALAVWTTDDRSHVPSGRGFMRRNWDTFVPPPAVWDECLRTLKPGGHLVCFASPRTADLMALSIRLAGFEIRDSIHWIYGSGWPKSMDVSKAIDKSAGAEREVVGTRHVTGGLGSADLYAKDAWTQAHRGARDIPITVPATEAAARWAGWGTALKPAHEPITLARKPLEGTVASNVVQHGTGGLHIDACRVGLEATNRPGRWPANIVLTHQRYLDRHGRPAGDACAGTCTDGCPVAAMDEETGGASRYFPVFRYEAKAPASQRPRLADGTVHPTVKPLALMRWLVRLITPPGGLVLDPFAGSGTTLQAARNEGMRAVGIERHEPYAHLCMARLAEPYAPDLFGDIA